MVVQRHGRCEVAAMKKILICIILSLFITSTAWAMQPALRMMKTEFACKSATSVGGIGYGTVKALDNKCWTNTNIGATAVATASNDSANYGWLYQLGRLTDEHQIRTSGTSGTQSSSDTPGNANFIYDASSPYDWRSPQNDNLWQGVNGVNNPCPPLFRVPTQGELAAMVTAEGITSPVTAIGSTLKIPLNGFRSRIDATVSNENVYGTLWSSTMSGTDAVLFSVTAGSASTSGTNGRATGYGVRCIKN